VQTSGAVRKLRSHDVSVRGIPPFAKCAKDGAPGVVAPASVPSGWQSHDAASTVSFKPIALVTATRVESRGFPRSDKARYRLSRSMPAALATLAKPPLASAMRRRAQGRLFVGRSSPYGEDLRCLRMTAFDPGVTAFFHPQPDRGMPDAPAYLRTTRDGKSRPSLFPAGRRPGLPLRWRSLPRLRRRARSWGRG
jgi:hypothetical protein